ncbi:MAG: LPS export ABC transporter permease LptG [Gallionella sp.]|nr:LPS export ABC transporter permease LptG [Gallionella sp.]
MNLLTRYLGREIYASIALVFAALILLFAFLDLIHEMNVMQGKYGLGYVLLFVVLTIPGHVYELFPVAVLIGTIVALVHLAANSELTVYRASGASLFDMLIALFKIGLPLVVLSFVCGEFVAPPSERMAQKLRLKAQNTVVAVQTFRSGVWVKDEQSFVNIKNVLPENRLQDISIYQFDKSYHLNKITNAKEGKFVKPGVWTLAEVRETHFSGRGVTTRSSPSETWRSAINPSILSVLLVVPEQMSASDLHEYASHLRDNHQQSARYEIAMWNKLVYPFAVLVMMVLALPFAGHQHRSGGISTKIFLGIVLGLAFHFIGRLFASIGALNNWQPFLSATAMTGLFLLFGLGMLWWTERR